MAEPCQIDLMAKNCKHSSLSHPLLHFLLDRSERAALRVLPERSKEVR